MNALFKSNLLFRFFALFIALLMMLMMFMFAGCDGTQNNVSEADILSFQGYTASVLESEIEGKASFLVCGTGGRMDRIFSDGTLENVLLPTGDKSLTCILKGDGITIVGGLFGALAYSTDGNEFQLAEGIGQEHIMAMTQFKGSYYACTFDGKIFSSSDGMIWDLVKKLSDKPLIGIASDNDIIMAVTGDTDIFKSENGETWDEENYNKTYESLADSLSFSKFIYLNGSFIAMGHLIDNQDVPAVISTESKGEVWSITTLGKINEKSPEDFYPLSINAIEFFQDQAMGVCNDGRVLTITSCPTCNLIVDVTNVDLRCISISGDTLMTAGDNFEFQVLKADDLRQDDISAEQALVEMENGAVVIDVRTEEEYKTGHIPGCLHIPVDEIATRLVDEVPNTDAVVIFYCGSGSRSQKALETAQELGYPNVFNLGGISDWPYEIE